MHGRKLAISYVTWTQLNRVPVSKRSNVDLDTGYGSDLAEISGHGGKGLVESQINTIISVALLPRNRLADWSPAGKRGSDNGAMEGA